jgi:phosphoribosylformylglycinamidine synthase
MKVRIDVRLKPAVLDPQGAAVADGLKRLGFDEVASARVGKVIELELDGAGLTPESHAAQLTQMCDKLLANPVIEDYEITYPETQGR